MSQRARGRPFGRAFAGGGREGGLSGTGFPSRAGSPGEGAPRRGWGLRLAGAFAALALAACGDGGAGAGGAVEITLLHLNDLHAHLTPHLDRVPDGPPGVAAAATRLEERGGLARVATLVRSIRREVPDALLVNVGDTYHGGVEALFTAGNAIVDPVNALGIDLGVPGNWDFAYGPGVTFLRYRGEALDPPLGFDGEVGRPAFPNLAANVLLTDPARAGATFLPATLVREVRGARIGFIGLTSDIVPRMHPVLASGLEFLQGEEAYRELVDRHAARLRVAGADVVVVLSELGIHKDYRLAQVIAPGAVDVFLSAHTHEATAEPLASASGAVVVEAGNDGLLGRMDLTVRDGRVVAHRWRLLPIDASIEPDPEMAALVERARAPFLADEVHMEMPIPFAIERLDEPIDTVIGHVDAPLDRRGALESSFGDWFTDVLREVAGTDLAITPGFRFDAVLAPAGFPLEGEVTAAGDVTLEDAYRLFPVPFTLSTGETRGANVRAILEGLLTRTFSPDAFAQAGGWVDGFSGIEAAVDLSRPDGERVLSIARAGTGEPIAADDVLTVAGCSRPVDTTTNLCSHPGFEGVHALLEPGSDRPWTPARLLAAGLARVRPAAAQPRIADRSGRRLWPLDPLVQPLEGVSAGARRVPAAVAGWEGASGVARGGSS